MIVAVPLLQTNATSMIKEVERNTWKFVFLTKIFFAQNFLFLSVFFFWILSLNQVENDSVFFVIIFVVFVSFWPVRYGAAACVYIFLDDMQHMFCISCNTKEGNIIELTLRCVVVVSSVPSGLLGFFQSLGCMYLAGIIVFHAFFWPPSISAVLFHCLFLSFLETMTFF